MANVPIGLIFLVILFSLFIILIILYLVYYLNNRDKSKKEQEDPNLLIWGKETPTDNKDKNTCLLYQFSPYQVTGGKENLYFPGNPSVNFNVINAMDGIKSTDKCIDIDQVVAKEVYRECVKTSPTSTTDPLNLCLLGVNERAKIGDKEIYYSTNCSQNKLCPGTLSLVQMGTDNVRCLSTSNKGELTECDFTDKNQILRLVRKELDKSVTNGRSGNLIQIYDRNRNLCLIPEDNASFDNTKVVFTNCSQNNNGFVWYYLPGDNLNKENKISPPQLIYITNNDIDIKNKKALSNNGKTLVLNEISTDINTTYGRSQRTIIVDYLLYNV